MRPTSHGCLFRILRLTQVLFVLLPLVFVTGGVLGAGTTTELQVQLSSWRQASCPEAVMSDSATISAACKAEEAVSARTGVVTFAADEDKGEYLLALLPALLYSLVAVLVATALLRVVESLKDGDPFTQDNVTRLWRAAWIAGVGGVGAGVVKVVVAKALIDAPPEAGFSVSPIPAASTAIIIGFVLAVVAEVFRRGVAMREELETVI